MKHGGREEDVKQAVCVKYNIRIPASVVEAHTEKMAAPQYGPQASAPPYVKRAACCDPAANAREGGGAFVGMWYCGVCWETWDAAHPKPAVQPAGPISQPWAPNLQNSVHADTWQVGPTAANAHEAQVSGQAKVVLDKAVCLTVQSLDEAVQCWNHT